jgi:hypothetical protein
LGLTDRLEALSLVAGLESFGFSGGVLGCVVGMTIGATITGGDGMLQSNRLLSGAKVSIKSEMHNDAA